MDYMLKRFGDLVPVQQLDGDLWRYRCLREKDDGPCGKTRDLLKTQVNSYHCCRDCGREAKNFKSFNQRGVTFLNYRRIREGFSREQWERYYAILRGRNTSEDCRDAVERVLIEPTLDFCCRLCAEGKRRVAA